MIYIVISNIGLAIMMLVVYGRYSRYRIITSGEIRDLKNKLKKEVEERENAETRFEQLNKTDGERISALMKNIDELRREKEGEIKIRLEAEKQVEIAIQKTKEIENRIHDWRTLQDAITKDSREAIVKIGNDLFKKLNDSYKVEVETNRNLLARLQKNLADLFEGRGGSVKAAAKTQEVNSESVATNHHEPDLHAHDDETKKLIDNLTSVMKANGQMVNKDYFLPSNFDERKAKMLLCETAFVRNEKLYMFDFKSCSYIEDYKNLKDKNPVEAANVIKQKLDKYLTYLTHPKYAESINQVMAQTKAKFGKSIAVMVVAGKPEMQVLKDIGYYDKIRKSAVEIMDFDAVNNLVL
jgi:hypothetical protein